MRRKQVWRYYCDFCGKGRCQAASIAKHEKHCTKNPNRECGMCALRDQKPRPMETLKIALSDGIEALDTVTQSCPACILATIRQSDATSEEYQWSYSEACERFWGDLQVERERQAENEILAEMYGG